MANILVFGDSIAYGRWGKNSGWVSMLRNHIDKKYTKKNWWKHERHTVYNLGIAGSMLKDVFDRFECEVKPRDWEKQNTVLIFQVGIRDSAILFDQNKSRTKPDKFRGGLLKLIKLSKKYTDNVLFIGLTRVDEEKSNPLPWRKQIAYSNSSIEKYDAIIREVCEEKGVNYIDLFEKIDKERFKKYLDDGVHPNSEGHKILFNTIRKHLQKFIK